MIFWHKPDLWLTPNDRMESLRRKSSPRVNELDGNWSLLIKKRPCWFSCYFSKAMIFFFNRLMGIEKYFCCLMRRPNDQKAVPFDWKHSFKSKSVSKSKDLVRKRVGQEKFHFWSRLVISINRFVSCLVSCITENPQESTTGWIVGPSASIWSSFQVKHMKIIKHCLWTPEWVPDDKTWVMKTSKKIINILRYLEKILSRKIVLQSSILVARRQMRALHRHPTPSALNAHISSRYSAL